VILIALGYNEEALIACVFYNTRSIFYLWIFLKRFGFFEGLENTYTLNWQRLSLFGFGQIENERRATEK